MASTKTPNTTRKAGRSTARTKPIRKLLTPKVKGSIPRSTLRKAMKAACEAVEAT